MYTQVVYWGMRVDIRVTPETKEEWQKRADSKGITLTRLILDAMDGVHTDIVHTEDVATDVHTTDLEGLKGEIKDAIERGDRENWVRVKGLINQAGYSWDFTTKVLLKDGREVWRGYLDNL